MTHRFSQVALVLMALGAIALLSPPNFSAPKSDKSGQQIKDARLMLITSTELIKRIETVPLKSPEHSELISRAIFSHLGKIAYEHYTALWKLHPDDPGANLYRGVIASEYYRQATNPFVKELSITSPQAQAIIQAARFCLEKAVTLAPDDPAANREYGYFLFYQGGNLEGGISRLMKAESLAPRDAITHAALGDVLSTPNPPLYAPKKAEMELKTAISLRPHYAFPHWILARLYVLQKRYPDAQRQMQVYLGLAPEAAAKLAGAKRLEDTINKGLSKK